MNSTKHFYRVLLVSFVGSLIFTSCSSVATPQVSESPLSNTITISPTKTLTLVPETETARSTNTPTPTGEPTETPPEPTEQAEYKKPTEAPTQYSMYDVPFVDGKYIAEKYDREKDEYSYKRWNGES